MATHRPLRMVVKDFRIPLNQNAVDPAAADQTNESQNGASDDNSPSSSTESGESKESVTTDGDAVGIPAGAANPGTNRRAPIKRVIPDHSNTPSVADPYKKSAQDNHWHFKSSTTVAVAAVAVALVALIASLGVGAAIMSHKNRLEAAAGFLRTEGYVEMLEIPTHDEQQLCNDVNS